MSSQPAIFEEHAIRRVYDEDTETWWFSVIDIVQVLTQQPDYQAARNYWKVLKNRLGKEGSESVTECNRLKLPAADGKYENKTAAKTGGGIAKKARLDLEGKTGKRVISAENYLPPGRKKLAKK